MLDFFPTSFRKFAWTLTLGILSIFVFMYVSNSFPVSIETLGLLSMLLNIFIPGVLSFSGVIAKLSISIYLILFIINIIFFKYLFILHLIYLF
jgi:hypothetical protein